MRPFDAALRDTLRERLAAFERQGVSETPLIRAAVAVALVPDDAGRACFVLTRRASRPGRHAGQWALPGGRAEPEESPARTAVRELAEEVGLVATPDDVLGVLDDYETRSGFVITPVVVWLGAFAPFVPDPREVAAVYRVPLVDLESDRVPRVWEIPESSRPLLGVPLPDLDTIVHAPTAAILYQLREVGLFGRATRVAHYEQPVFAWQ